MTDDDQNNKSSENKITSSDRQMANQVVIMSLLAYLDVSGKIDGKDYLNLVDTTVKQISKAVDRPTLIDAVNTLLSPIRTSVNIRDKKQAAKES